jgi:hypothetical protein
LATASATARQRFIDTFDHYLDATVREAENREQGTILNLDDYLELRRGNSGVYPAYAVIECVLSIDLQPEVFNHPALWNLTKIAGDMLFTANVSSESYPNIPSSLTNIPLSRTSTATTRNKPVVTLPTTSSLSSRMNEGLTYRRPWISPEICSRTTFKNLTRGRNSCRVGGLTPMLPFLSTSMGWQLA